MWILLAICSAFFLGIYDIFKKLSLDKNAVIPTLFFSTLAASIFVAFPVLLSYFGILKPDQLLYVGGTTVGQQLQILLKSVIVVSSWILAFFAIKNLPLTIFAPIRSTGPLWTLFGALIIFDERLNAYQWLGTALVFIFFYLFSTAGKLEGIHFGKNKYVWFVILATLLGAASALYDRYLIREVDKVIVQSYFTFYQTLLLLPVLLLLWYPQRKKSTPFTWRWTIPLIGLFLLIADYLYFFSIELEDSLISVISITRRSSVVVVFLFGALFYKEKNITRKSIYLVGILIGVIFLVLGR